MIEYTSENGYTGRLYGKSSLSVFDSDGKEVLHTGKRSINTYAELKKQIEGFPAFMESLQSIFDDENCDEDDDI